MSNCKHNKIYSKLRFGRLILKCKECREILSIGSRELDNDLWELGMLFGLPAKGIINENKNIVGEQKQT